MATGILTSGTMCTHVICLATWNVIHFCFTWRCIARNPFLSQGNLHEHSSTAAFLNVPALCVVQSLASNLQVHDAGQYLRTYFHNRPADKNFRRWTGIILHHFSAEPPCTPSNNIEDTCVGGIRLFSAIPLPILFAGARGGCASIKWCRILPVHCLRI